MFHRPGEFGSLGRTFLLRVEGPSSTGSARDFAVTNAGVAAARAGKSDAMKSAATPGE